MQQFFVKKQNISRRNVVVREKKLALGCLLKAIGGLRKTDDPEGHTHED